MDISTLVSGFEIVAELVMIPFIIGLISSLKTANLIKDGTTPLVALFIGSILGVLVFCGINEWTIINAIFGIMLGGSAGLSAVGLHQLGQTKKPTEI